MSSGFKDDKQRYIFPARLTERLPIIRPLLERNFRLFWIGESISLLGNKFHFIALSWLTLQITGSGLALGAVLMVGAIPRAILILFGGALSDRLSPRYIMIVSNIIRGFLVATIALIVFFEVVELWHLYVLSVTFGIADAFFYPAFNSIVPKVLAKDEIEAGNAILRGMHELSLLIGSAPAGLLISAVGIYLAFGVDAISFALAALALSMMSDTTNKLGLSTDKLYTSKEPLGIRNILSNISEGLKYAWNKPAFRAMFLAIAIIDFCFAGPLDIGLAWLANNRFIGGASAFGIVLSSFGGGALVGTIIAGSVKLRHRGFTLALIGILAGIGLGLYGIIPDLLSAAILSVIMGVGVGIFNIVLISWLQKESPANMVGRIMSLLSFASVGVMPISFAISGVLVDVDVPIMFAVAGGLTFITCLYLFSVRAVREID
jgi:MFS family permease